MGSNTLKMKIVVLGSPGVGKGTYTQDLTKIFNVPHISTGALFREHIKGQTELGKEAKEHIDAGRLVPDELTNDLVKERISREDCQNGFIFDGYPRNIPQAEAFAKITDLDLVINFKADKEVIIERLSGRRTCSSCGWIFHLKNIPSRVEGVCDKCGGKLIQRSDEMPEVIKERLVVYEKETAPLINYYKEKNLLKEITVNEDYGSHKELIQKRIVDVINSIKTSEVNL